MHTGGGDRLSQLLDLCDLDVGSGHTASDGIPLSITHQPLPT